MNFTDFIHVKLQKYSKIFALYNVIPTPHYIIAPETRNFSSLFFMPFSDYIYNIYNSSCNNLIIITLTTTNFFKMEGFSCQK